MLDTRIHCAAAPRLSAKIRYLPLILKPFVREQCAWVCAHHGDFQLVYYGHHVGADPMKRERHRASSYFDDCVEFCERRDQASFDPACDTLSLDAFALLVREVFARKPYDPAVLRPGAREPLSNTPSSRGARASEDAQPY